LGTGFFVPKLKTMKQTRTEVAMAPIKGFEDYHICDDGSVYSTKISPRYNPEGNLRLVKPRLHPSGYLYYGLFVGEGKSKQRLWRRGHRLVYETFGGKIENGFEIDHIDGNKHNNDISNLRSVTRSENIKAMYVRKRSKTI
jgi:hypothetical protein